MKILQLVTRREFRGAQMSAFFLSRQLQELGHSIYWVGLYDAGNDVLELPGAFNADLSCPKSSFVNFSKVKLLKKFINDHDIDIVQANGSDTLKYSIAATTFNKKVPVIYRNISQVSFWLKNSIVKKTLNKFLLSQADHIVSVGTRSMEDLLMVFPSLKGKVSVISRGVPSAAISKGEAAARLREEFGLQATTRILLWAGSFSAEKYPAFMVEVMKVLQQTNPDTVLLMAGKGSLEEDIKRLAIDGGLRNRILFTGYRNDMPMLYAASDIFLLGSKIEGVPGVVLEAAVQSTPAVAVSVGGVNEVITDDTGILLQSHDAAAFAKAVAELLNNEPKRKAMGDRARAFVVNNYNEKANAAKFDALYKQLKEKL